MATISLLRFIVGVILATSLEVPPPLMTTAVGTSFYSLSALGHHCETAASRFKAPVRDTFFVFFFAVARLPAAG